MCIERDWGEEPESKSKREREREREAEACDDDWAAHAVAYRLCGHSYLCVCAEREGGRGETERARARLPWGQTNRGRRRGNDCHYLKEDNEGPLKTNNVNKGRDRLGPGRGRYTHAHISRERESARTCVYKRVRVCV